MVFSPGIYAETPLWIVTDPPRSDHTKDRDSTSAESPSLTTATLNNPAYTADLHIRSDGKYVVTPPDAHIATSVARGGRTSKPRPHGETQRLAAF